MSASGSSSLSSDKKQKSSSSTLKKEIKLNKKVLKGFAFSIAVVLLLAIISVSGAAYAYQDYFNDKPYFGVKFFGSDIGGMSTGELTYFVEKSLQKVEFSFQVDGDSLEADAQDLGIDYNEIAIVKDAINAGKNGNAIDRYLSSIISLAYFFSDDWGNFLNNRFEQKISDLGVKYELDDKKFNNFIADITKRYNKAEKNAALVMNGDEVKLIPAVYGKEIIAENIHEKIKEVLESGDNEGTKIVVDTQEVEPKILDSEVKESVDLAHRIIDLDVVLSYDGKEYRPSSKDKGNWIIFSENGESLLPSVDANKVEKYLQNNIAPNINISPVNQKIKVINGSEREVIQEGKNGLAVDTKSLAQKIALKLNSNEPFVGEIPTYIVKYKTEFNNVLVADWSKYIEVDISSQRMCAYLAGGEKVNCWAITSGQRGWDTPIGTFLISRKSGAGGQPGPYGGGVCMPNPPSTTPLCGINYVSTFTSRGHAIHEAWWRSSFGGADYVWNGSHGCINATYDIAKFIYYWAPLGTPIVIHY